MKVNFSSKYFILLASAFLLASTQVQSIEESDYSDALAFGSYRTRNRKNSYKNLVTSYKPYRVEDTQNPEVSEQELLLQLNPASRQVYNSMSEEGKAKAREFAGDHYRANKNDAVRAAAEMMQDKHHEWDYRSSK